jgi:hypothetical protein
MLMMIATIYSLIWVIHKIIGSEIDYRLRVMHDFYDLRDFIIQQIEDPFMSDEKWRELLPICRFADNRYRNYYSDLNFEGSCEALVLRILGPEGQRV